MFTASEVKLAARGRWGSVFSTLTPCLKEAMAHPGRHVPCPVHGGEDGFRLFKDFEESGAGICNTCGAFTDGISMIQWINRMDFVSALNAVADCLGLEDQRINATYQSLPQEKRVSIIGRLIQSGEAPYGFNEGAPKSCYVSVAEEGKASTTTIWGTDLGRAVRIGKVVPGDWVECSKSGCYVFKTNGETRRRYVWFIRRTDSPGERADKARQQREVNAAKARRIADDWNAAGEFVRGSTYCTPAERYLESRGITHTSAKIKDGDCFRFNRSTPYYDDEGKRAGTYPAIICAVRDVYGDIVTLHRTYLTLEGRKAPVATPKKLLSPPSDARLAGAAIRFAMPSRRILAVAEGVETALSVQEGMKVPCWSTVSAYGMETFVPPEGIKLVLIMADKDRSGTGEKAARKLKERLEAKGIDAFVLLPKGDIPEGAKGIDWNDVLLKEGREGFPKLYKR